MSLAYFITLTVLLTILAVAAYVDRVYSEMGKFLAREYQDNIDSWEQSIEPRLRLGRESIALSASVLRQLTLAGMALLWGLHLYTHDNALLESPGAGAIARAAAELILLILIFDRLIPQILFSRTRGLWLRWVILVLQVLFYLILPVTIVLQLLLSIAALAEPEDTTEEERPSEAMDALLEAGEEEGILEESDRELVRSVVEFGDKVVREVMTPRPEIFAVAGTLTLREFTTEINEHAFSRVPVYAGSLDHVTGIAFAHDLLKVLDIEAGTRTVAQIQRPAAFVPETKKVAELLREMQREKQHMRIVIDEYGGVAGLVTIEDLLEAIVGDIADEHDEPEPDDEPVKESDGSFVVPGNFELSRLRELFADQLAQPARPPEAAETDEENPEAAEESNVLRLPENYESTTLGGLVSEIAGRIPPAGEVVEQDGLRLEVLAATDRRIDRIRVSLPGHSV
jgi:CBS domain containing-hemolysin-like protein